MPQENVFHNLLFLLEKRRKTGEGHTNKTNKEEKRRWREEEGRTGGGRKRKPVTPERALMGEALCGPIF